jgi:hypothetical protein
MKKSLLFSFLIYSLCLLSACGGGSTQPNHVATHFSVAPATSTPTAGTPFNITVTALDSSGQIVPSYSGTVHFTSSNGQPVLPASAMITTGTETLPVTLNTVGSQTITATDAITASITGTSSTINVSATVATHFSVTAPAAVTAGSAFNVTLNALDASNAVVTGYSGAIHFASSNGQPVLPASVTMTSGTGTFSVTLNTIGSQTITATDTVTASITGTSNSINVSTAAAASPVPLINQPLSPDAIAPGGAAFKLTVNGTGFVPGSIVKWNGSARVTISVSSSQLTASVLASDIANANTASVMVVNPAPGGGTSNVAFFETTKSTSFASWSIPSALATGAKPSSVATADFDGDGKLDMVVTNGGSNSISILLGNGDGTFRAAVDYPAGTSPSSVAVGDFNGDGKLDLAVANFGSNDVSIFFGNGDGTFQAAVNYAAGTNPSSVAVGDFISDGRLDLAVANFGSLNVSVLLGNGDGTFQTALDYGAGPFPSSVAVGDFNGDGKLDLVVANSGGSTFDAGSVSILLGNGDGTFQAAVDYLTGGNNISGASVAVGDFNGDGKLDLAVSDPGSSNFVSGDISILLGNGDGTFQSAVNYPTLSRSASVAVGDFNGDGKLDLAVSDASGSNLTSGDVSILLGNGDGTFQPATFHDAGTNPSSVAMGDFNGDGRMDLAVTDQTSSIVSILLQPVLSGPNAGLSSTILAFGTQVVGTTSPGNRVVLSNDGTAILDIAGIAATTNFGESDNCGSSLAPGASCTISVTFSPTAIDNLTGTLSITDNAPGSPQTVSLNGAGTVAKLVPAFMDFTCGQTCPPGPKTATLTNTGATALSISNITIESNREGGHDHGFSQTNNCPSSLGAGQSCSITVSFVGLFNFGYIGDLLVTDNGGGSPQTVSLRGFASN